MSETLTKKEIEIVQAIADGESIVDVSERMKLSYAYTKNLVLTIRKKMHCETTYNVVATAIRQGVID